MKIGANGLIWSASFEKSQLALLPEIRSRGFDGFAIPIFNPAQLAVLEIRATFELNQLECTVCAILPPGMNPISPDSASRKATLSHLSDCVKVTADLGAKIMAGPLYALVGYLPGRRRNDDEWKWAVECFQQLGLALESNHITLALEPLNRFVTFFITTAAEAGELCDAIGNPRIGVLLDTFHTNIEEKNDAHAFTALGSKLKHVHAGENDRGIPGTGHVDFVSIVKALREMHYDGYLVIESFGFTLKELGAATAIWRDLAPTPESIAFESIKYLRRLATHA